MRSQVIYSQGVKECWNVEEFKDTYLSKDFRPIQMKNKGNGNNGKNRRGGREKGKGGKRKRRKRSEGVN